jgi:L-fucose isomerase-like protein
LHFMKIDPAFAESKLLAAYKLYLAICDELATEENVVGVGANCLNESFFSDTTPCLAWNLLYKERGLVWSCEGDTMSLLTQYIVDRTIKAPVITTNIYPFLVGMTALAHEKISEFPNVPDPDDHALLVHCGFFGFVPEPMATRWVLKDKILSIVDDDAHMIDAEIGTGAMTLTKIHSSFDRLFVCDAQLEAYVQYPGSDCQNGGLIRVRDGHDLVDKLYSHHVSVITGNHHDELVMIGKLIGLTIERC